MRRSCILRLLCLAILLASTAVSSLRADSCDLPNSAQAVPVPSAFCFDRTGAGAPNKTCLASGAGPANPTANMPDIGGALRRLTSAVQFRKGNSAYYFTPLTGPITLAGCAQEVTECACDNGEVIAARALNQYAKKALNDTGTCLGGYTAYQVVKNGGAAACVGAADPGPCTCTGVANSGSCSSFTVADAVTLQIQRTELGCGFTLSKVAGSQTFTIANDPPCIVTGTWQNSGSTNVVGIDLPPTYMVQLNPNGVNGIANFSVKQTSISSPVGFSVNTTGKTLTQIQSDIQAGFQGLGLGLSVVVDATARNSLMDLAASSPNSENSQVVSENQARLRYASGPVVRITNANTVFEIRAQALDGQILNQEGNVPQSVTPGVPVMSGWGALLLALLLLASSYWFFWRQRPQRAD